MKKVLFFLMFIWITSCNYFNVKKTSSEAILNEELKTFNWNEVDEYPVFKSCDTSINNVQKEKCFETTLLSFISDKLYQNEIVVSQDLSDTIFIEFKVDDKGTLEITQTQIDSLVYAEIPEIEKYLYASIDSLPEIYPAIKRGQQVTTKFKLPLIVKVSEN